MPAAAPVRPFTGRKMAAILVGGFGVVIGVNLVMAWQASSTFGGVVVENSYVASQHFNRWLDQAEKARALGWTATATRRPDGRVALATTGVPAGAVVTATARHPVGRLPAMELTFAGQDTVLASREALPAGRWIVRLTISAQGETWKQELDVS